MKGLRRLLATTRAEVVPVASLDTVRRLYPDVYARIDDLPRGPARAAAWHAYFCQIYCDALLGEPEPASWIHVETAQLVAELYAQIPAALELAGEAGSDARRLELPALPHWQTPLRTRDQLVAMRGTLDTLRTFLGHDLLIIEAGTESLDDIRGSLALIDKCYEAEGLWIPNPSPELRERIGDLLTHGLKTSYDTGRLLANPAGASSSS